MFINSVDRPDGPDRWHVEAMLLDAEFIPEMLMCWSCDVSAFQKKLDLCTLFFF